MLSKSILFTLLWVSMASARLRTSQTLNLREIMLEGRQNWRGDALSFENLCKCQCREDLQVYDRTYYSYKGNCQTRKEGLHWCYIPDEAVPHCIHAEKDTQANSYWSLDACYTPAPSDEPCSSAWALKYARTELVKLKMCAVREGAFNAQDDNLKHIMDVCYMPKEGQPDMGCEERIETRWGPAVPCRCWNINNFEQGVKELTQNRHLNCVDGAGVAFGGRLVNTAATSGLAAVKVDKTFKVGRRCQWTIVPRVGGSWKCVRPSK